MERLCKLLFELSNEERLTILTRLNEEPMKLTHLSRRLGYKPQEASRNVKRLNGARLIGRDADGVYSLTTLGEESLRLLDGYRFLLEQSEYFENHTLKDIPSEFLDRIGALVETRQPIGIMSMIFSTEKMVAEAEEYVLIIADSILMSYIPLELESIRRGIKNRIIHPRGLSLPPGGEVVIRQEKEALAAEDLSRLLEVRYVDRVDVYLAMSEREVSGIAFRTVNGVFDHMHFSGSDLRFHGWCKDLFEYYWARSHLT